MTGEGAEMEGGSGSGSGRRRGGRASIGWSCNGRQLSLQNPSENPNRFKSGREESDETWVMLIKSESVRCIRGSKS